MMRRKQILNDVTAAQGRFACLECYSSALAWSCLGWLRGGACVALAALLQGACMTLASQLGSGIPKRGQLQFLGLIVEEGSKEPQLWASHAGLFIGSKSLASLCFFKMRSHVHFLESVLLVSKYPASPKKGTNLNLAGASCINTACQTEYKTASRTNAKNTLFPVACSTAKLHLWARPPNSGLTARAHPIDMRPTAPAMPPMTEA